MPKIVDHDERRAEISAALWRVIDREGMSGVSVRSVAKEAGYPKATMTYYFANQSELLMYAMEESIRVSSERIGSILADSPTWEDYVEAIIEAIPSTPKRRKQTSIWLEVISQAQGDETLRRFLLDTNREVLATIIEVLQQMQREGLVASDISIDTEARVLHAIIDGLSLHTMTSHRVTSPSTIREIATQYVERLGR